MTPSAAAWSYALARLAALFALATLDERYPRRRAALLKEWREREGVPERHPTSP